MSKSLKEMSSQELRAYMLANRNDDDKMRAAIKESTSRPGWTKVPADADVGKALSPILTDKDSD